MSVDDVERSGALPDAADATDTDCSRARAGAPHGFDRNRSLNEDRYVCECDGWLPRGEELDAARARVAASGKPSLDELIERFGNHE